MGKPNLSDESKRDTVAQITERGYLVAEVSQRLGASQHSLFWWKRHLGRRVSGRCRQGRRDPPADTRTDWGDGGARHPKTYGRPRRQGVCQRRHDGLHQRIRSQG